MTELLIKLELPQRHITNILGALAKAKHHRLNLAEIANKRKGKTRYYKNAAQLKEEHLQVAASLQETADLIARRSV